MAVPLNSIIDCGNARRITNLASAIAAGQPVTFEQLQAAVEGIAWKDSVRVASVANVTISGPGATIDGITMAANDRVLLKNQTTVPENGIYIWNGSAVAMTRALDASTFDELEGAVVNVEEGTNVGTQWRQTQVNGVIGTNNVVWTAFGSSAPAASEATAGIAEIATQGETDTGTDDTRMLTPLKAKTASWMLRKFSQNIGDASATSIAVTHNFNTKDVQVYCYETGGSFREILVEKQHNTVNQVTMLFDAPPALNAIRVVVIG